MKMTTLFGRILMVWTILSCQEGFAQGSSSPAAALQNTPNGKIIYAWYTSWSTNDWNSLEQVLATGFTFSSPVDDHINVKAVKERCWPNASNIARFEVEKFAVNGDEAFVISKGWNKDGKLLRNTDYFRIKDGKIQAYECFFGPGINFPNSGK
jgi:ketosteroid isomerase-like protein